MLNVKVGDEVRVFDVNGPRMGQPAGGWHGEVVKIGRKFFTVAYAGSGREMKFLLETGRANDAWGHRSVKTLGQAALDQRLHQAMEVLTAHRIEFKIGNKLTLEQIEALANVARTFTDSEKD